MSSRRKRLEWDLFMLLYNFCLFCLSPREQMFQEGSLISSSGDFVGEVASSIKLVAYG